MENKFNSPQEEALEIALITRRKLLDGQEDVVSVLRNCLVVAVNVNNIADMGWIKEEITGDFKKIPSYRKRDCLEIDTKDFKKCDINFEIKLLADFVRRDENINDIKNNAIIRPIDSNRIIDSIINKCLFFLNKCISELQYGGYMQSIFEKIRKNVDNRLKEVDPRIFQEIQPVYSNLMSINPADWPKVALSSRRILKYAADKLFPASETDYITKDGRIWKVGRAIS